MELKLSTKSKKISTADLASFLGRLWQRIYFFVFFVVLLISIAIGFFVWQQSLNGSGWSEEKKQQYLSSQNKSVFLNEDALKAAVADIQFRKNYSADANQQIKDIFAPNN